MQTPPPLDLDWLDDGTYALLFAGRVRWTGQAKPDDLTRAEVLAKLLADIDSIAVARKTDGAWWIRNPVDQIAMGPYARRDDADADARGIKRFYLYQHLPRFVTSGR